MCAETESETILEDNLVVLDTLSRPLAANGVPVARLAASARVCAALESTWSKIAGDRGRVKQTARVERQHPARVAACNSQLRKMIQVCHSFFLAQTNQANDP